MGHFRLSSDIKRWWCLMKQCLYLLVLELVSQELEGVYNRSSTNQEQIANIVPGMEFIDGTFVMRVHEVKRSGQIHAIKAFKILPTGSAIKVVNPFEVVVYSNVENVHNKILAMLE
jgi:hypothetical protein